MKDNTYYQEPMATIYCGDALEVLKALPAESVQMAMTSPPYWGLRNYAGGTDIVWGGDENCEHEWDTILKHRSAGGPQVPQTKYQSNISVVEAQRDTESDFCSLCGAWRGQLGLEPAPELYVEHLMMVFREVKRVLRKDGSFYLNIGDTYASGKGTCFNPGGGKNSLQGHAKLKEARAYPLNRGNKSTLTTLGLQPKCMVCIPERVMFAMIEDDWVLRNKIIWHKPNSMPGSQKSRFTSSWEYLYFFTKNNGTILWRSRETSEWRDTRPSKDENYPYGMRDEEGNKRQPLWMGFSYYFDLDAVRVPHKTQSLERYQRGVNLDRPAIGKSGEVGPMQQYKRAPQWFQEMFGEDHDYKGKFDELFDHGPQPQSFNLQVRDVKRGKGGATAQGGELKASQEEIEEYEYPEKHHGSSMSNQEGLHIDRARHGFGPKAHGGQKTNITRPEDGPEPNAFHPKGKNPGDLWSITTKPSSISVCPQCDTVFPRLMKICPNCKIEGVVGHFAPYPEALCEGPINASSRRGDTVLDMFAGGGSTGVAAKRLGRKAILIDCVRSYCIMARYKLKRVEYQPELEHSYQNI